MSIQRAKSANEAELKRITKYINDGIVYAHFKVLSATIGKLSIQTYQDSSDAASQWNWDFTDWGFDYRKNQNHVVVGNRRDYRTITNKFAEMKAVKNWTQELQTEQLRRYLKAISVSDLHIIKVPKVAASHPLEDGEAYFINAEIAHAAQIGQVFFNGESTRASIMFNSGDRLK